MHACNGVLFSFLANGGIDVLQLQGASVAGVLPGNC
jgi:hypothetical protein